MATAVDLYNINAVTSEAGSRFASWALLSTDNQTLTGPPKTFAVIKESEYSYKQDTPETEDESGDTYVLQGGKVTAEFKATVMQQDKAVNDFYKDYYGENIVLVKEVRRYKVNGKAQVRIFPRAKVVKEYSNKLKGETTEIKFKIEPSPALMTLDLSSFTANFHNPLTCTSCVVPAGTYDVLVEI